MAREKEKRAIRYSDCYYAAPEELNDRFYRIGRPAKSIYDEAGLWTAGSGRYRAARWFEVKPGKFVLP